MLTRGTMGTASIKWSFLWNSSSSLKTLQEFLSPRGDCWWPAPLLPQTLLLGQLGISCDNVGMSACWVSLQKLTQEEVISQLQEQLRVWLTAEEHWRQSEGQWACHSPVRRGRPPGEIIGGPGCWTRYDGLLHSSHVSWVGFEEGSVFVGQHSSLVPAELGSSILKPHLEIIGNGEGHKEKKTEKRLQEGNSVWFYYVTSPEENTR